MTKKILSGILAIILVVSSFTVCCKSSIASQSPKVRIELDNKELVFDVEPFIENGRLLVPMRTIFEAMGAKVSWNNEDRTIKATKGDLLISLKIGEKSIYKNGVQNSMDVPAQIVDNRTFVPLRFVSEALNAIIAWDENTKEVKISMENKQITKTAKNYLLFNETGLMKLKKSADKSQEISDSIKKIIRASDKNMTLEPPTVIQKKVILPGANIHDYISMGYYFWPDPSKPNGLPYIEQDGKVNPETRNGEKYDHDRRGKMIGAVNSLALGYCLTDKEEYAEKATEFLRVWFIKPETKMNPSLDYSQGVPGKSLGRYSGIIDTVDFITLIDSVRMLENSTSWTQSDSAELKKWFSEYVDWLLNSELGKKEAVTTNNHGVWYDAQVAVFSVYSERFDVAKKIVEEAKQKRISAQIQQNGSMPRELGRTRSTHYSLYNLAAFVSLARAGEIVNIDLWNYTTQDGRSIKKAIDFLVPYISGDKKWEYANIIEEKNAQYATYIAIASSHYKTSEYDSIIDKMLSNEVGEDMLQVKSFIE